MEWTANKYPNGYGCIWATRTKRALAHRLAYQFAYGKIPDGMVVMHKCDNRACCNPEHLMIGTQQQNVDDMVAKDRQKRSKLLPFLTEIVGLRAAGKTQQFIADKFGVSR